MASSKEYLAFILDQLSGLEHIAHRTMMGEYILYYRSKVAAYLCDNRLLVKPVPAALRLLPEGKLEPPYAGAKPMLLVENVDDGAFLCALFDAMLEELPQVKKRLRKETEK